MVVKREFPKIRGTVFGVVIIRNLGYYSRVPYSETPKQPPMYWRFRNAAAHRHNSCRDLDLSVNLETPGRRSRWQRQ